MSENNCGNTCDQKHFSYEGNANIDPQQPVWGRMGQWTMYKVGDFPPDANVDDVQFMVPARIAYSTEGGKTGGNALVFVDVGRKEVYTTSGKVEDKFAKKIFECLNLAMYMPEDTFEAEESVYEELDEVQAEHDELYGTNLGDS